MAVALSFYGNSSNDKDWGVTDPSYVSRDVSRVNRDIESYEHTFEKKCGDYQVSLQSWNYLASAVGAGKIMEQDQHFRSDNQDDKMAVTIECYVLRAEVKAWVGKEQTPDTGTFSRNG